MISEDLKRGFVYASHDPGLHDAKCLNNHNFLFAIRTKLKYYLKILVHAKQY
jgi:hypothetical protein